MTNRSIGLLICSWGNVFMKQLLCVCSYQGTFLWSWSICTVCTEDWRCPLHTSWLHTDTTAPQNHCLPWNTTTRLSIICIEKWSHPFWKHTLKGSVPIKYSHLPLVVSRRGLNRSQNLCRNKETPRNVKPRTEGVPSIIWKLECGPIQNQEMPNPNWTRLLFESWDWAIAEPRTVGPKSGQETQTWSVPIK